MVAETTLGNDFRSLSWCARLVKGETSGAALRRQVAPWGTERWLSSGRTSENMATIQDVARTAGVSPATVSRVLAGKAGVDATLAARVRLAASELRYRPSGIARSLRTRKSTVWGVIVSDIRNPFFTDLVRGVEDAAREMGYSIILTNTDEQAEKEKSYVELFAGERMAGAIIVPASQSKTDVTILLDQGVPVVSVDREVERCALDTVLSDNEGGAYQATTHLLDQGFRKIACITGPTDHSTAIGRTAGYQRAMAERLRDGAGLVRYADFKQAGGYVAAYGLLSGPIRPDALFVANNEMTLGALEAIEQLGLVAPDDVGVVGFDDPPWASLLRPRLTAVSQPSYDMGIAAAGMLASRIRGDDSPPRTVIMRTELHVRGSSLRLP